MKIGFIGLGIMGNPMAKNLIKHNHQLVVYDHNQKVLEEFKGLGAEIASSARDVASQVNVIITMLPNSPHVRSVCLGEKGIVEASKSGLVVIDMSSIDPVESQSIGKALSEHGIELLDCPVSGGEPKAIDGTISVMAGGRKETFEKYYDLIMCMAGSAVWVGELGSGNICKLANQIIVAGNIAAMGEAMVFATKAGANPELIYQAIRGGLAGSTVLDAKAPMVLNRNFKPGFRIELHMKDLLNAVSAAHAVNASTPLTSLFLEMMVTLRNDGYQMEDHSALVKYFEKINNIIVEKK